MKNESESEFAKFDSVMKKIITISHKELQDREKKYKRERAKKKRAKA